MSKIVVFCENYPAIQSTLYVATHNYHDGAVTLAIIGFRDLFKFFQVINERVFHNAINLIYSEPYQARRLTAKGLKRVFHVLPDIIKERRYLKEIFDKYFAEFEGCEVVFFTRAYNGYLFYLLKRLSEKNRLVYISHALPHITPMRQYTPMNFIGLVRLIILRLIYGHDIAMGKLPYTGGFPYIPDRFFEKTVDRIIDWEEKNEMMKGFDLSQFKIFDVGDYSVIYFDQPLVEAGYVTDRDVFNREMTEIFSILAKYFPEKKIARKYHPGHPGDKTVIKIGDVLPDFIPAEFLYSDNVKMYLSIFSTSLAKVEKGLAVSLIDLITFKSDKFKEQVKEMLIKVSRSEILFPKSLDEFERVLVNVVKREAPISW